ncbi:SDR family NAD(P)-dependent oxidoreductase [Flavisphingomonas formosensis]|uniref:SDR family NAD(P)-dependent oxidoreductase n=1 Tax=Flavisphingomonas formosensis TaxID=861534 RepID=UPI0012F889C9|nr:SDR family NAD(P)-dependent oxidoreductase [Sphingomonas formosensis]
MDGSIFGLEGKRALVIGGGRGMGESSARLLAQAGCDVAVLDVDPDRAGHVAEEVRMTGRRGIPVIADILDETVTPGAIAKAEEELGGLDVMVTIVGQALFKPLMDVTIEEWDYDQNRNLRYFFVAARAVAASLLKRGKPGSIVCIASVDGLQGAPFHASYGAAKSGLIHLVKSMASEWGRNGIRVNAVVPGTISTPRLPDTDEMREAVANSPVALGYSGTTDDIGKAVLFLASDMASYTTGSTVMVDGGWMAGNLFDPRFMRIKHKI